MSTLRIGYALFKGASQAGVVFSAANAATPGNVEIETNEAKAYKLQVQRLSNNEYWNGSTKAWQAGDPTTADITVEGSDVVNPNPDRRLIHRPSLDMCAGIDSDGVKFTVYPVGGTAGANGASVQVNQALN
jgi:hypothetical protein